MHRKKAASMRPHLNRRAGSRAPDLGPLTLAERLLTVREVAALLHVSRPTVLTMIRDGELPAVKLRRTWRIDGSRLKGYVRLRSRLLREAPVSPTD